MRLFRDRSVERTDSVHASHSTRLLLVAWMVAGVETQYRHLRSVIPADLNAAVAEIFPYLEGGRVERLPLPSSLRGTLRCTLTLLRSMKGDRSDIIWSQVALPMLPFVLTAGSLRRTPTFYAIDCTPALLWGFGGHYPGVTDPESQKGRLAAACLRLFLRRCAGLLPWSDWAAESFMRDYGADPASVHVVPPGVDVRTWRPGEPRPDGGRVRLLFVGGDFERKGGPLLLNLFRTHLRDGCELHLVTRVALEPEPWVHMHTGFQPGDPALRDLYQRCDLLVLPTLADCYSIAALEAMACGLPVVISRVGGIPEIVVDAHTGALVPPGDPAAFLRAVRALIGDPALRRRWGAAGRSRALSHFSAEVQSGRTLRIMAEALDLALRPEERQDVGAPPC